MKDKIKVDEYKFTRLVDEKMKEHEKYEEGMGVRIVPGSGRAAGYEILHGPNERNARSVASWARKEVWKEYDLVVKAP